MNLNLEGKTALITGGSGDIGHAICKKLSTEGVCVILQYNSNEKSANAIVEDIKKNGGFAIAVKFDLENKEDTIYALKSIIDKVGKIDILVNNAGVSSYDLFIDMNIEEWDRLFNINVRGTFICSQYILNNSMLKKKYGKIINISSIWGCVGASCEVAYSSSKAAIIGLTKALAKEMGPSGITVNCVAPGVIETKMLNCFSKEELEALRLETPIERLGTPDDVANIVCFLSSDSSSFITGQVISPNGGFVI